MRRMLSIVFPRERHSVYIFKRVVCMKTATENRKKRNITTTFQTWGRGNKRRDDNDEIKKF